MSIISGNNIFIFINDIVKDLTCGASVFADDAKLYIEIRTELDVATLQMNLDRFASWCSTNKLDLNTKKCVKISFCRRTCPILSHYYIDGVLLDEASGCRDLGIFFDQSLSFVPHVDQMVASARRTLAFVIRVAKNLRNVRVIKLLFLSLVVPKIEYASLVWSPVYQKHINAIEQLQRRFLKFLSWKVDGVYPDRGADLFEMCDRFDLLTLHERRTLTSILFIIKLIRGNIDCPQFLELLPFRVPATNSRYQVPFYLPLVSSTLMLASPLYRACNSVNLLVTYSDGSIDIFNSPMSAIFNIATEFVKSHRP